MQIQIFDGLNYVRHLFEHRGYTLEQLYSLHADANLWPNTIQMWVWEGTNGNERRRRRYARYKTGRTPPFEQIFAIIKDFEQLLTATPGVYQTRVYGYEGDDVVANLVWRYHQQYPITIVSSDKDFRQLYTLENVNGTANPIPDVADEHVRLYKTLVGDPSDSIPGIPGFGWAAWNKCDPSELSTRFLRGDFTLTEVDGLRPAQALWAEENLDALRAYWEITGFYRIPVKDLNKGTRVGQYNPALVESILSQHQI